MLKITDGYYISSEDLQSRLGTSGDYEPFGNKKDLHLYISRHGIPQTHRINGLTIHSLQYRRDWDDPAWIEPASLYEPDLSVAKPVKKIPGLYKVQITAPKTLLYPKDEEPVHKEQKLPLPRWFFFMDSVPFGLYAVYDPNAPVNNNDIMLHVKTKELQKEKQLALKDCYIPAISHGSEKKFKDNGKKDKDDSKESKDDSKPPGEMNFYIGGLIIWNEMARKDLPSVITWQKDVFCDRTEKEWLDQMELQPRHPCVRPIFRQYSNLYPIMRPIVDLDSYSSVTSNLMGLKRAFRQSWDSPQYMPVTRDMSGQNREIIKAWLENPVFCDKFVDKSDKKGGFEGDIDNLESLQSLLQAAVELEISTLPPYLSALYSIKPNSDKNKKISKLIRSIIMEEMSHLALACNLLLSTKGGQPKLAYKDVIKRISFPRKGLASCKIQSKSKHGHFKTVSCLPKTKFELLPMNRSMHPKKITAIDGFLKIEAPVKYHIHDPDVPDDGKSNGQEDDQVTTGGDNNKVDSRRELLVYGKDDDKTDDKDDKDGKKRLNITFEPYGPANTSIGAFYELVRKGFVHLSRTLGEENIFVSKDDAMKTQAGPTVLHGLNFVYDLESALTAINTIVSEGEGTSLTDIWSDNQHLSHFHKFLEIKVGHPIEWKMTKMMVHIHMNIYLQNLLIFHLINLKLMMKKMHGIG